MSTNTGRMPLADAMQFYDTLYDLRATNVAAGTSPAIVWPDGGDLLAAIDGISGALSVASGSANDTAAGTGARTVQVSGLVAGVPTLETATMNGQTAVVLATAFDVVMEVRVLTAGSGGVNAGAISVGWDTVTAGAHTSGKRLGWVPIGAGAGSSCHLRVASGLAGYPVKVSVQASAAGTAYLCFRQNGVTIIVDTGPLVAGIPWCPHYCIPPSCEEDGDIFIQAKAAASTILVTAHMAVALHVAP